MPLILIVEDDPQIVEAIEKTLTLEGSYRTESIASPHKVLRAAVEHKPALILLDIRLPGGDGRHVLKDLKRNPATSAIPVIFLTGMSSEGDKVLGLNLGADDYVVKPFGAMELLARVRSVLRRSSSGKTPGRSGTLRVSCLKMDPDERRATLKGKPITLQPKEFEILFLLASHSGKALTRAFLIENSSTYGMNVPTRSLDTHIKNLRKKLGPRAHWIETVPKLGYRFEPKA